MTVTSGLRICIASSGLGHVKRGVEAWAADLGQALAERGEQVLLCKGAGTPETDYERVIPCWQRTSTPTRRLLGCLPKSLGWRLGLGSGYGVEQTTFALNLIRLLREQRIDVLHLQDPQVAVIVQHALRTGWIRTRTIMNHGTEEPPEFLKKITYLQHGAPWHQQQAEADGIWKETWTMIPNFVNTDQFRPGESPDLRRELEIPPESKVILVSAAIKKRHKRVDYLIDEVAEVLRRRPELPVCLVLSGGRCEETDELLKRANDSLGDRVRFAVGMERSRMPELYRMADLLIHGSLKEMMPMALLEATASGLPCLVHRHPVMQWMVGPGGMTLDMRIEGGLAATIIQLLEDAARREQLGRLAREHCQRLFSREVVVDQILSYYRAVVSDHERRTELAA